MHHRNSHDKAYFLSHFRHPYTHTSRSPAASQVQRKACSGIWCLLKEISVREQAPSKALLRDRGWSEVLVVRQLWNPPCPHLLRCHQQPLPQRRGPESLQHRRGASRYTKVPVSTLQADTCTPTTESRSTRPAIPRIHICACCGWADSLPATALQVKAKMCMFIVLCHLGSHLGLFVVAWKPDYRQWLHFTSWHFWTYQA